MLKVKRIEHDWNSDLVESFIFPDQRKLVVHRSNDGEYSHFIEVIKDDERIDERIVNDRKSAVLEMFSEQAKILQPASVFAHYNKSNDEFIVITKDEMDDLIKRS